MLQKTGDLKKTKKRDKKKQNTTKKAKSPYYGYVLVVDGSRIDIAIRCNVSGFYDIITTPNHTN